MEEKKTFFVLEVMSKDGSKDTYAALSLDLAINVAGIDETCIGGQWWTVKAKDAGDARLPHNRWQAMSNIVSDDN